MSRSQSIEFQFFYQFNHSIALERVNSAIAPRSIDWKKLSDANLLSLLSAAPAQNALYPEFTGHDLEDLKTGMDGSCIFPEQSKDLFTFFPTQERKTPLVRGISKPNQAQGTLKELSTLYQAMRPLWNKDVLELIEQRAIGAALLLKQKHDKPLMHLVQSRPGRFQTLSFSNGEQLEKSLAQLRHGIKLLKEYDYSYNTSQNCVGFFNGHLTLAAKNERGCHAAQYYGFKHEKTLDLELGTFLAQFCANKKNDLQIQDKRLSVYVLVPFLNLAHLVCKQFKEYPHFKEHDLTFFFPELIFGSSALLGVLDFLVAKTAPRLLLDLSAYPWINICAVGALE